MKDSIKKGFGFGLTSGIITTLGLMIGLYFSTKSVLAVIGGIIVIAVADSLSDSLGMHISEETNKKNSNKEIWEATISTFCFKFLFALSFIVAFLFCEITTAIIINIFWGLILITLFSYYISWSKKQSVIKAIAEHLLIAIAVIILTYYIGISVGSFFG